MKLSDLSKTQIASIKRTFKSGNSLRTKIVRIDSKIESLRKESDSLRLELDLWEEPVKRMTGGYTSEEILSGAADLMLGKEEGDMLDVEDSPVPIDGDASYISATKVEAVQTDVDREDIHTLKAGVLGNRVTL